MASAASDVLARLILEQRLAGVRPSPAWSMAYANPGLRSGPVSIRPLRGVYLTLGLCDKARRAEVYLEAVSFQVGHENRIAIALSIHSDALPFKIRLPPIELSAVV